MTTHALMEKVAQVAPDKYAYIVKMASVINEGPYRDEVVEQLDKLVKKANASMGQRFGNAAAGIGVAVGTGIAMSLAGDMFEATKRGLTKSLHYRRMLKENPDLSEMPARKVQKAFATLHRFNSDFSGDPMVAAAYVRKASQFEDGVFDPQMLTNLVSAKKTLTDQKKLPIPSRSPWESMDESKLRGAQTAHFQNSADKSKMEAGFMGADQARRGEAHQMQMQTGQANLNRAGAMGPLEMQRMQQQVGSHQQEMDMKTMQAGRQHEEHQTVTPDLKRLLMLAQIEKAKAQGQYP